MAYDSRGQPGSWSRQRGQKKVTQEKAAPVSRRFVVSLRYSTSRAAVELALEMKEHGERARAQTVLAEFPGPPVLLGGSQGVLKARG